MIPKKQTGIPEYDSKQPLLPSMAKLRDYSFEQPLLQQVAKEHFKKKNLKEIEELNKKKVTISSELQEIQRGAEEHNMLFPSDYSKMQIEKGKNLETDLKETILSLNMLKRKRSYTDDYRKNLKIILKRFFNFGGISNRTVIIPMKNNVTQQDITKINKGSDAIGNIVDVLNTNREVLVQAIDDEIIAYLKDNGYSFVNEKKEFYDGMAYNTNNKKINLVTEFKKIREAVKNLPGKRNLLTKMDSKNPQYQKIADEIKKISDFKNSFLSRIEVIKNQSDDLENIDNINVIVLSWIPRQIMSQSTGTIWKSCMSYNQAQDENAGMNIKFVGTGMEDGVFIAWLTKVSDLKSLSTPKARILIKPFINESGEVVWWPSNIYHDGSLLAADAILFKRILKNYCHSKQKDFISTKLKIRDDKKVYEDDIDQMVDDDEYDDDDYDEYDPGFDELQERSLSTDTFEYQVKKNDSDFYKLFYSVGFTNKKLFDLLEKKKDSYFNLKNTTYLFKVSYITNNLFFMQYVLGKSSEDNILFCQNLNDVIVNNSYNEKGLNIYFNFIKAKRDKGDFHDDVFSFLYMKVINSTKRNINDKILNYFLKNEDVMANLFKDKKNYMETLSRYFIFNAEQKKEINKYIKKYLTEKEKIDGDEFAQTEIVIDSYGTKNRTLFGEIQSIQDKKKNEDTAGIEYLKFFSEGINHNHILLSNEILKKIIIYYNKYKDQINSLKIRENQLKTNITIAYIRNLSEKEQINEKLANEAKKLDLINGKFIDHIFLYQIIFDKDLLIQYLEKHNSDTSVNFFIKFSNHMVDINDKVDIMEIILYVDNKLPDLNIFKNKKFFSLFQMYNTHEVDAFGQLTKAKTVPFILNEKIINRLIESQNENYVMIMTMIEIMNFKNTLDKNIGIFIKIFKNKKITFEKVDMNIISSLIIKIIQNNNFKKEFFFKIIECFDASFLKVKLVKAMESLYESNSASHFQNFSINVNFIKYLIDNNFIDDIKKSEKTVSFVFNVLVNIVEQSATSNNLNIDINSIKEKNKLFIEFILSSINNKKDLSFALNKTMSDKINGEEKKLSRLEKRFITPQETSAVKKNDLIEKQSSYQDSLDMLKLYSTFFTLVKILKIDKALIKNNIAMEYFDILYRKNKSNNDDMIKNIIDKIMGLI